MFNVLDAIVSVSRRVARLFAPPASHWYPEWHTQVQTVSEHFGFESWVDGDCEF